MQLLGKQRQVGWANLLLSHHIGLATIVVMDIDRRMSGCFMLLVNYQEIVLRTGLYVLSNINIITGHGANVMQPFSCTISVRKLT